jgi:hypothetical protein
MIQDGWPLHHSLGQGAYSAVQAAHMSLMVTSTSTPGSMLQAAGARDSCAQWLHPVSRARPSLLCSGLGALCPRGSAQPPACPAAQQQPSSSPAAPHAAAHLIEVICLTTSAAEMRSIRRLWILQAGGQAAASWRCRQRRRRSSKQRTAARATACSLV